MAETAEIVKLRKNEANKAKIQMFFFLCVPSVFTCLFFAMVMFVSFTTVPFLLIFLVYSYFGAWVCASSSMIVKDNVSLLAVQNLANARAQLKDVSACEEKNNPYMRLRVMRNVGIAIVLFVPVALAGWLLFILYCCGKFLRKLSKMAEDCDKADTMLVRSKAEPREIAEVFQNILRYAKSYNVIGEKKGFASMLHRAEGLLQLWELSSASDERGHTETTSENKISYSGGSIAVSSGKRELRKLMNKAVLFILLPYVLFQIGWFLLDCTIYGRGGLASAMIGDLLFDSELYHSKEMIIFCVFLIAVAVVIGMVGAVFLAKNVHGHPKSNIKTTYAADFYACVGKLNAVKAGNSVGLSGIALTVILSIVLIIPVVCFGWLLILFMCCDVLLSGRRSVAADCDAADRILDEYKANSANLISLFNVMADYAKAYKNTGKKSEYEITLSRAEALLALLETSNRI